MFSSWALTSILSEMQIRKRKKIVASSQVKGSNVRHSKANFSTPTEFITAIFKYIKKKRTTRRNIIININ